MQKQTPTIIISLILIIAAFFGGKAYGASHAAATAPQAGQFAQGNTAGGNRTGGTRGGFNGAAGTVVSKDATSITVSIPNNGGSKIILYSPSTTVLKSTPGAITDIAIGSTVTATGTSNSDGSVTATSIQIRPAGMPTPQGTRTPASSPAAQ